MALLGYAPDADPSIIGVITSASGVVPSLRGIKGAPSPVSAGMATLAATCVGSAFLTKLDGTTRFLAGAPQKIYEAGNSTWTDVSRAATYTTGLTGVWRFAQQGNVSFAANGADTIQASVSTGAFSCVPGAPIASIVETVGKFVFAANTSGNSSTIQWSALNDYTSWSASVITQAGNDTLTASAGAITAAKRFGNTLIVYKKNSMFLGVYVGPPNVWEINVNQIPGNAGALSQEVVVDIGTADNPKHIFMGEDDFYVYDGSRPLPIGTNRIKQEVFGNLFQSRTSFCKAQLDKKNSLVRFYYPTIDTTKPNSCRVYNYRTDKWGVDDRQIEAAVDYVAPAVTYDGLGSLYATYDDLPVRSYDSGFLGSTQTQPAIFSTSHLLQTLTGPAGSTSFTTWDLGDDAALITATRVRPRFITAPTTAMMTNYYKMSSGDSLTADQTVSINNGKFDFLREARWHRLQFAYTGDWEQSGLAPEWERGGDE